MQVSIPLCDGVIIESLKRKVNIVKRILRPCISRTRISPTKKNISTSQSICARKRRAGVPHPRRTISGRRGCVVWGTGFLDRDGRRVQSTSRGRRRRTIVRRRVRRGRGCVVWTRGTLGFLRGFLRGFTRGRRGGRGGRRRIRRRRGSRRCVLRRLWRVLGCSRDVSRKRRRVVKDR